MNYAQLLAGLKEHHRRTGEHVDRMVLATNREQLRTAISAYCADSEADVTRNVQDLWYRMGLSDNPKLKPKDPVGFTP